MATKKTGDEAKAIANHHKKAVTQEIKKRRKIWQENHVIWRMQNHHGQPPGFRFLLLSLQDELSIGASSEGIVEMIQGLWKSHESRKHNDIKTMQKKLREIGDKDLAIELEEEFPQSESGYESEDSTARQ